MDEQQQRIVRVIAEQLGIKESQVTPEKNIVDDLWADPLDEIELVMGLENEFGIEIEDSRAEKVKTVADAFALVAELAAPRHGSLPMTAAKQQGGWLPIETAPEDEHILIATTGGHVGTAYWTDEGDGKVWAWGHPQRDGGDYVHPNLTPQAWMPLPKHPGAAA